MRSRGPFTDARIVEAKPRYKNPGEDLLYKPDALQRHQADTVSLKNAHDAG